MATGTNDEVVETATRPDLVWDDEARGLCLRGYSDGSKSFIFLYCIDGRQRFLRIGRSPEWSLKVARTRAKELRWIVDQGRDPASENRGRGKIAPVEGQIRYSAENPPMRPQLLRERALARVAANIAKRKPD
jgi:Arm DNA-binding domain